MNIEAQGFQVSETHELPFEIREIKEGLTAYIFDGVTIGIDTTGKNNKELPEIVFGQFDAELGTGTFSKPEVNDINVNMEYVSECIKEVSQKSGFNKFWFYPYGEDSPAENNERRERARMKLFMKASDNIQPAPSGHGYILTT